MVNREIGLNITENVRVNLKDNIDTLKKKLEQHNIEYAIPYEKTNNGETDMVVVMRQCGMELTLKNGNIQFIKSNNSEVNTILEIDTDTNPVDALKAIKDEISKELSIESSALSIDKFDSNTFSSMISARIDDGKGKVKIELGVGVMSGTTKRLHIRSLGL